MASPLTIEDYHNFAKSRNWTFLGETACKCIEKTYWKCDKGHKLFSSLNNLKNMGHGCSECYGNSPRTLEDCKKIALEKGVECLSTIYKNTDSALQWQCKNKHIWNQSFYQFKKGQGCPICNGTAKLTLEFCQELAKNKGGRCLSEVYTNNNTPMLWECKQGHVWKASAGNIKLRDSWCPLCIGKNITIEDCRAAAEKRQGKCLSDNYTNLKTKMNWQCHLGHVWSTPFIYIKAGHWCHVCNANKIVTIETCRQWANKKGGKCLSDNYKNNETKLKWKCSEGHIWNARWGNICQDKWCPVCAKRQSKFEVKIREHFIEVCKEIGITDATGPIKGILPSRGLELDCYSATARKAIECDGRYWHSFEDAVERDIRKNRECKELGIELLRINYSEVANNPKGYVKVFKIVDEFLGVG